VRPDVIVTVAALGFDDATHCVTPHFLFGRKRRLHQPRQHIRALELRNPVQRGHRFQRKADSIPVITDSR
jgi:hypothetical protein